MSPYSLPQLLEQSESLQVLDDEVGGVGAGLCIKRPLDLGILLPYTDTVL
jgi:hypothetical protein